MTRTRPLHLVLLGVLGGVIGWFLETVLATSGSPILVPPITLAAALTLISALVIVLALPVRRVARKEPNARIDPFYATRVVTIAKAASLSGALLGGVALAIVVYLATRPIEPALGSVTVALAMAGAATILLAAGLIAEQMCTLPPDDKDSGPSQGPDYRGIQ